MIFGTVNWNNTYNNTFVSKKDALKHLDYFYDNGGRYIDTAYNYKSTPIIHEWLEQNPNNELKVNTKIWKIDEFWKCFNELANVTKIYCVMARENNKDIVEFLRDKQKEGIIEKFGISCYLPEELGRSYWQVIQIPCELVWFDKLEIISLYANVWLRSYYNLYKKQYGEDLELIEELKKNKKIDFVIGIDNKKQLIENMKKFGV